MAVYFPWRQQNVESITRKFLDDLSGVEVNNASAIAFVTNQELTLGQREALKEAAGSTTVELYHLERVTAILDKPQMAEVRKQFLRTDFSDTAIRDEVESLRSEVTQAHKRLEGFQTGGETFCYWMLYHFDITRALARNFVVIRQGVYPLYDVRIRIRDMDAGEDVLVKKWGEINSPADYLTVEWQLPPSVYYRIFFHARNDSWNQDLMLKRSSSAECWLAATRVKDRSGREIVFEHVDNGFVDEFGEPTWRP